MVIQHYINADSYNTREDEGNWSSSQVVKDYEYGEVQEILKEKLVNGFLEMLVVWRGYVNPTWEPLPFVSNIFAYREYVKNKVFFF